MHTTDVKEKALDVALQMAPRVGICTPAGVIEWARAFEAFLIEDHAPGGKAFRGVIEAANIPAPVPASVRLPPAVPVDQSVTPETITCLACGKRFRSLKRHIGTVHGQTPAEYRAWWTLPSDYPVTAPDYSERRAALAREMGLGHMRNGGSTAPPAV